MQNYGDRLADAKAHLKKQSSELGEKHLSVAGAALAVGLLMQENGDYRAAHQYFEQALQIRKGATGSLDETIAQCYYYIGKNQYEQEDFEAAEISYKLCLDCFGDRPGDSFLATVLNGMAYLYHDRDKFHFAEPILKRALAIRATVLDAWSPEIAESLDHLGWLYSEHGHFEEAENLFVRAIEIFNANYGFDHASTARAMENYASLLKKTGRVDEANKILCNVEWIRYRPSPQT
ncbi:MAG: tetratricopeptide repeat protein [Candidatus Obscuribacterales bacterium]|nr:tetratricopeptide repeat protein [Candidatus Obscuribacterales bacterium]